MIDAAAFATMRRGSFFINAARGELVDDAALLAALDAGHLGGCALDVGRAPDQMPTLALARHPLRHRRAAHRRAHARGDRAPGARDRRPAEAPARRRDAARRRQRGARPPLARAADRRPRLAAASSHERAGRAGTRARATATCTSTRTPTRSRRPRPSSRRTRRSAAYRAVQRELGLQRTVVVQPTGYGLRQPLHARGVGRARLRRRGRSSSSRPTSPTPSSNACTTPASAASAS